MERRGALGSISRTGGKVVRGWGFGLASSGKKGRGSARSQKKVNIEGNNEGGKVTGTPGVNTNFGRKKNEFLGVRSWSQLLREDHLQKDLTLRVPQKGVGISGKCGKISTRRSSQRKKKRVAGQKGKEK